MLQYSAFFGISLSFSNLVHVYEYHKIMVSYSFDLSGRAIFIPLLRFA